MLRSALFPLDCPLEEAPTRPFEKMSLSQASEKKVGPLNPSPKGAKGQARALPVPNQTCQATCCAGRPSQSMQLGIRLSPTCPNQSRFLLSSTRSTLQRRPKPARTASSFHPATADGSSKFSAKSVGCELGPSVPVPLGQSKWTWHAPRAFPVFSDRNIRSTTYSVAGGSS